MTKEQKDLLIKDICSRLPYGLKCKILETNEIKTLAAIHYDGENTLFDFWEDGQELLYGYQLYLSEFKPCLLPLPSTTLTLDQRIEYSKTVVVIDESHCSQTHESYDWFNKNNLDYRGLVPMELAVDATGLGIY